MSFIFLFSLPCFQPIGLAPARLGFLRSPLSPRGLPSLPFRPIQQASPAATTGAALSLPCDANGLAPHVNRVVFHLTIISAPDTDAADDSAPPTSSPLSCVPSCSRPLNSAPALRRPHLALKHQPPSSHCASRHNPSTAAITARVAEHHAAPVRFTPR